MALVPNGEDAGHHRSGVLQHFVKVQAIDVADRFDEVHIQIDGVVITATHLQVGECMALGELQGQDGVANHQLKVCVAEVAKTKLVKLGQVLVLGYELHRNPFVCSFTTQ
jgi:hypothetical protein